MKRVLWVSRHEMTPEQKRDLDRVMDDEVELTAYRETVQDMKILLPLIQKADAVAVVLPPDILQELLSVVGEKPVLRAIPRRIPTENTRVLSDGRQEPIFQFVHDGWEQVLSIEIKTRRL